jgi:hypothetical protein
MIGQQRAARFRPLLVARLRSYVLSNARVEEEGSRVSAVLQLSQCSDLRAQKRECVPSSQMMDSRSGVSTLRRVSVSVTLMNPNSSKTYDLRQTAAVSLLIPVSKLNLADFQCPDPVLKRRCWHSESGCRP